MGMEFNSIGRLMLMIDVFIALATQHSYDAVD